MSAEARVFREGVLRWVQASGQGGAWATASAPASGTFGYVQAGLGFTVSRKYQTIADRGVQKHHKLLSVEPQELTFKVLYAITGDWPNALATASGVSVPAMHMEFKAHDTEAAGKDVNFRGTGYYFQFYNAVIEDWKFAEAENGDTWDYKVRALSASGWNSSGCTFAPFSRN